MTSEHPFAVHPTRDAEKDLLRLRPWTERVVQCLLQLEQDPRRGHSLRGNLRGARSLEFSLPGGAYRAAYVILESERICVGVVKN
jgi:hypothetical protein